MLLDRSDWVSYEHGFTSPNFPVVTSPTCLSAYLARSPYVEIGLIHRSINTEKDRFDRPRCEEKQKVTS